MAFGNKKQAAGMDPARLASVAGLSAAPAQNAPADGAPRPRVSIEPDISRIRPRGISETPEERKRRLAAKTINFTATIIARLVILAAGGLYLWNEAQFSGGVHRGAVAGMIAMTIDLGRVAVKASTPGTK